LRTSIQIEALILIISMSLNFVLIATAIFSLSRSWGSTSHFVIAAIAQKRLLKCYPEIFDKAVEILNFLKDFTNSGEYPFLDAAMFADDIKTADWKTFSPNHFYHQNFGYVKGNLQINEAKNQDGNILTGLVQSLKTLKGGTSPKVDTRLSMSLELRMLMHYVGDIHQPLHTISRITKNHLEGILEELCLRYLILILDRCTSTGINTLTIRIGSSSSLQLETTTTNS